MFEKLRNLSKMRMEMDVYLFRSIDVGQRFHLTARNDGHPLQGRLLLSGN